MSAMLAGSGTVVAWNSATQLRANPAILVVPGVLSFAPNAASFLPLTGSTAAAWSLLVIGRLCGNDNSLHRRSARPRARPASRSG